MDLSQLSPRDLREMKTDELRHLAARLIDAQQTDRRENALLYYQPVPNAMQIHQCEDRYIGIGGGNGSSKTETALVEMVMCATGVFPESIREALDIERKFRGPMNCRVVCESLTTVLYPIILPKLQWFRWTGIDQPGGERGHWGWIPRTCLIGNSWEKSWSDKLRILRVLCRDPDNPEKVLGESTIQFCSVDQDESDFASGDFHFILHDEPPSRGIWEENEARSMRVNGRMWLAMTWPSDPAIPVDFIYDEMYEPGTSDVDNGKSWFNLYTTDNPHLDQTAVAQQMKSWSPELINVRIYGGTIRFSNLVHPEFTDQTLRWCFKCNKTAVLVDEQCQACQSREVAPYNHVSEFDANPHWPTIFLLDPHPRKDHMFAWVQIDPNDDLWQIAEGSTQGDPVQVKRICDDVEHQYGLRIVQRLIDPNMARSPSGARREITWQDEFDRAGLRCDLADDSDVGRNRLNEYLKPDRHTCRPRVQIHRRCSQTILQMKRYVWDDYKRSLDKGQKQKPKDKNDDFPTLWKYLMNAEPSFRRAYLMTALIRRHTQHDPRTRVRQERFQHALYQIRETR